VPLGSSWVTPFASLNTTKVRLSAFTETGVEGANLDVESQSHNMSVATAGVKWTSAWNGIVPEARIAYRYRFGESGDWFRASFADAPNGSEFQVAGAEGSRGSVVAGFNLGAVLSDRVSGRLGYQGRFGSQDREHSLTGSLTIAFGPAGR